MTSADQSGGGVAPEKPEHVLQFAPAMLRHRERAVSLRDFEDLVRQRYSEVVQARAFNRNGRVQLIVVTRGADPVPTRAQQREMRRMLLEIAPAALGARNALTITGPRVRKLVVEVDLRVSTLDAAGTLARQAQERLVRRFATNIGGDLGEGWALGRSPSEDDIAEALLDIPELDGVASIKLFEANELGIEKPWSGVSSGDLVMLSGENIRIGFDVMEAAA